MLSLSRLLLVCLCATTSSTAATTASAKAREINSELSCNKCRTRFTFLRPTRDNVSYILFGDTANNNSGRSKKQNDGISFNHGEYMYYVVMYALYFVLNIDMSPHPFHLFAKPQIYKIYDPQIIFLFVNNDFTSPR